MKDEEMVLMVVSDEGEIIKYDVLFTFESGETGKNYIVYTDETEDEEGNTKAYASIYNPDEVETILYPIETKEEWEIVETALAIVHDKVINDDD